MTRPQTSRLKLFISEMRNMNSEKGKVWPCSYVSNNHWDSVCLVGCFKCFTEAAICWLKNYERNLNTAFGRNELVMRLWPFNMILKGNASACHEEVQTPKKHECQNHFDLLFRHVYMKVTKMRPLALSCLSAWSHIQWGVNKICLTYNFG